MIWKKKLTSMTKSGKPGVPGGDVMVRNRFRPERRESHLLIEDNKETRDRHKQDGVAGRDAEHTEPRRGGGTRGRLCGLLPCIAYGGRSPQEQEEERV